MLTMAALASKRVFVPRTTSPRDQAHARRAREAGKEPRERGPRKLGRVHHVVFSDDGRRVVGILVRRPDVAGVVARKDVFVALDALVAVEGGLMCEGRDDSFDAPACARLGIDLDACFVWAGMDVYTESGKFLGRVLDARFSEATGDVDCFCAQEGSAASALVGTFDIPAAWLVGYGNDRMVVRDQAAQLEPSGGLAARAGEGFAGAKEAGREAAAKAGAAADRALDKGGHALGRAIGRTRLAATEAGRSLAGDAPANGRPQSDKVANMPGEPDNGQSAARAVGRQLNKTRGMFSGFMREFKDASK